MAAGNVLRVWRLWYWHFAIDMGDGSVVEFASPRDGGVVRRIPWEVFEGNGIAELVPYDWSLPRAVVVRRALARLGQSGYDALRNNCEHFVNCCKVGRRHSAQIETAKTVGAFLFLGLALVAALGLPGHRSSRAWRALLGF